MSYCRLKSYTARIWNFAFWCHCDLDLDQMAFIYELDVYPLTLEDVLADQKMNFLRQGFRKLSYMQTFIHSDSTKRITLIPRHFAGGNKTNKARS